MKFSTTTVATIALVAGVILGYTFTGFSPIKAQNMTAPSNMSGRIKTSGNLVNLMSLNLSF